jgi:hypothetical protein
LGGSQFKASQGNSSQNPTPLKQPKQNELEVWFKQYGACFVSVEALSSNPSPTTKRKAAKKLYGERKVLSPNCHWWMRVSKRVFEKKRKSGAVPQPHPGHGIRILGRDWKQGKNRQVGQRCLIKKARMRMGWFIRGINARESGVGTPGTYVLG